MNRTDLIFWITNFLNARTEEINQGDTKLVAVDLLEELELLGVDIQYLKRQKCGTLTEHSIYCSGDKE